MLHPGSCNQNVSPALAIFDESTSASIRSYFPDREDAAGFLQLVNMWWKIANAKSLYNNSDTLGSAATHNDKKPDFLRKFAEWINNWQNSKIKNCEKFQLSKQTSDALSLTLKCHAALIEDLLKSPEYTFVLTSRYSSLIQLKGDSVSIARCPAADFWFPGKMSYNQKAS